MFTDDIAARARRQTLSVVAKFGVVGLVLAAVLGLGFWLLAAWSGNSAQPQAEASTAPSSTVEPTGSAPAASASSYAADDLRWVTVAGASVPVSRASGPRDVSAGRARGFSHDARGAAFAAIHLTLRVSAQVGPTVYGPTIDEQVIGTDAQAMRDLVEDQYEQLRQQQNVAYGQPAGRFFAAAKGYRIDSENGSMVNLRLLIEAPGANNSGVILVSCVVQLRWINEDWAILAPPSGDWGRVVSQVNDSRGYTMLTMGS